MVEFTIRRFTYLSATSCGMHVIALERIHVAAAVIEGGNGVSTKNRIDGSSGVGPKAETTLSILQRMG